jgi:hypothetical protein
MCEVVDMMLLTTCVSTTFHQLPALDSTIGSSKAKVVAARLLDINPELRLTVIEDFIDPEKAVRLVQVGSTEPPVVCCQEPEHGCMQQQQGSLESPPNPSADFARSSSLAEMSLCSVPGSDEVTSDATFRNTAGFYVGHHGAQQAEGGQNTRSGSGAKASGDTLYGPACNPPFDYVVDCIGEG